jgi:hypothetical protein
MLDINKKGTRKIKSHQPSSTNNLIVIPKNDCKSNQPTKNLNVVDFIKQKKKFILENSFDIKGTREFLASKEVAMRVIKLNDEIIEEDKKTEDDYCVRSIYDTNVGEGYIKIKNTSKKLMLDQVKNKFRSNKDIFLCTDLTKFKKELITIKDGAKSKDNLIQKKKSKKKSKKNIKESSDKQVNHLYQKKKIDDNILKLEFSPKKLLSSSGLPIQKKEESLFLFSEMNKKLMADEGLNLSGISDKNLSPKINKNSLQNDVFRTDIKNTQFKSRFIKKITENIYEEDKNLNKSNEQKVNNGTALPTSIPINSDKESLISILSDLI